MSTATSPRYSRSSPAPTTMRQRGAEQAHTARGWRTTMLSARQQRDQMADERGDRDNDGAAEDVGGLYRLQVQFLVHHRGQASRLAVWSGDVLRGVAAWLSRSRRPWRGRLGPAASATPDPQRCG